jgi:hypothetical protein
MIRAINWITLPIRIASAVIIVSLALLCMVVFWLTPGKLNEVRK